MLTLVSLVLNYNYRWGLSSIQRFNKLVKHKLCVDRPRTCFRMELRRKPWIRLVFDAFIGTIIHIDKQFLPVFPEGCGVNSISVILRGYVTLVGSNETHGLIMRE